MLGGSATQSRCGQPPFYVKHIGTDDRGGTLWRQCTKEYKLEPIRRETRRLMEEAGGDRVIQWIGISLDEAHRMKTSGTKYIENRYPLVDLRMSRHDCERWLDKNGFPVPPKSACRWCPYKGNVRWRQMKAEEPEEFERSVAFDNALRAARPNQINGVKITGQLFLHRSCTPLESVDFSNDLDRGQGELFGNECEGMCGV